MASTTTLFQPPEATAIDRGIGSGNDRGATSDDVWLGYVNATAGNHRAVFKWDVSSISTSAIVTSATMSLKWKFDAFSGGESDTIKAYRITNQSMTESVTWTTYDGTNAWSSPGSDYTTTNGASTSWTKGEDVTFSGDDFVALVQDAITNRGGFLSIVCATNSELNASFSGNDYMKLWSSNAADSANYPSLSITYTPVTHWTGGADDGNLDTADNWSGGARPVAGDRVLFSTGSDEITSGSLTAAVVCVGPNFSGKLGHAPISLTPPLKITANSIVLGSKNATIAIESMLTTCAVQVTDANAIAERFILTGVCDSLTVSRTRSDVTMNIAADRLIVVGADGNTTRMTAGTAFGGTIDATGPTIKATQNTAGGTSSRIHSMNGATVTTADSGSTGFVCAGGGGNVNFKADQLVSGSVTTALPWEYEAKYMSDDAAAGDYLGSSIAISGVTLVVGAPGDDDGGSQSGSVYVFVRSGNSWVQQAKLVASDAAASDNFGFSVAIDGETCVVGSPYDDDTTANSGSVYVFKRSGALWTQEAKIVDGDGAEGQFGTAVAISGNTVVAGKPGDDSGFSGDGSAFVFTRSGTTWTQEAKITGSNRTGENFGHSVDIDSDSIAVGAPYRDHSNDQDGSVYIFTRSGTTWTEEQEIYTAGLLVDNSWFGSSVSISGNSVVGGSPLGGGYVEVWTRSGTTWTTQQVLTRTAPQVTDGLGFSVDLSGDYLIAGANTGQTFGGIFWTRSGTTWANNGELWGQDSASTDYLGQSVATTSTLSAIGAKLEDEGGTSAGSFYTWHRIILSTLVNESVILDGTLDAKNNPNENADIGDKLAVFWPGDVRLNSTTGGVNFDGSIFMFGGDFSVGGDTVADIT